MKSKILLTLASVICSGCMTTAAVIDSPRITQLTPDPPRFYELALDLSIKDKKHHVEYSWMCEQKAIFTASVMQWVLRWKPENEFGLIAKQLDDGTMVIFVQPFCFLSDETSIVPKIFVINNGDILKQVSFFDARYDFVKKIAVSEVVLKGLVRRVPNASSLGRMSDNEREIAKKIESVKEHFVLRRVLVTPESLWRQSKGLTDIFLDRKDMLLAMDMPNQNPKSSGFFRFNVKDPIPFNDSTKSQMKFFSPLFLNGVIRIDENTSAADGMVFRYEENKGHEDKLNFCYMGRCLTLEGNTNEIYDPTTRDMVSVWKLNLRTALY